MQPIVIAEEEFLEIKARKLARGLSLDFLSKKQLVQKNNDNNSIYYFVVSKKKVYLRKGLQKSFNPITCDFLEWSKRSQGGRLTRCMKGLSGKCSVIDATAGFGKDSLELASVFSSVTLIERLAWMNELLIDGINLADQEPAKSMVKRFNLIKGDAKEIFLEGNLYADVIYLDPMFPNTGSAKAKKSMQALRELTEEDDTKVLLECSMNLAKRRVVVKRHRNSPPFEDYKPDFSIKSRVVRFDIYMTQS